MPPNREPAIHLNHIVLKSSSGDEAMDECDMKERGKGEKMRGSCEENVIPLEAFCKRSHTSKSLCNALHYDQISVPPKNTLIQFDNRD